jgi:hypothetical protein
MKWLILTIVIILLPVALHAQDVTTKVDITLTGGECTKVTGPINVAVNGNDRATTAIKQDGPCHWSGDVGKFIIEGSTFSLRLNGMRTDCRSASPDSPEKSNDSIAQLQFPYNRTRTRHITISTDSSIYVSYIRELPRDESDGASLPCMEADVFKGSEKIMDVRLPYKNELVSGETETLRLWLREKNRRPHNSYFVIVDTKLLDAAKKGPLDNAALASAYLRQHGGTGRILDSQALKYREAIGQISVGLAAVK